MKKNNNRKYILCVFGLILFIVLAICFLSFFLDKNKKSSLPEDKNISYFCKKEKQSNGVESFEEQYQFVYSLKDKKVLEGERKIVLYFMDQEHFENSNLFETFAKQNVPNVVTKDHVALTHTVSWDYVYLSDLEKDINAYIEYLKSMDYLCEK